MKKVLCNKISIILLLNGLLITIYTFLVPLIYMIFQNSLGNKLITIIFIPILVILYIVLHILWYKRFAKKMGKYIWKENNTIIYDNKIFIPTILILKIVYKLKYSNPPQLLFYLCDDTIQTIYISKIALKKVIKELKLTVIYKVKDKEIIKKERKQKITDNEKTVKTFIKDNKLAIIFFTIGLVLTVVSFILHNKYNNIAIKTILIVLCVVSGWLQLFCVYVKKIDRDVLARIIVSTIATIVILVIMTLLIMLLFNDMDAEITSDCIFIVIYLFPSFILVGLVTLLILSGM